LKASPHAFTDGAFLNPEIEALIACIRAVADPPFRSKGLVYAKN